MAVGVPACGPELGVDEFTGLALVKNQRIGGGCHAGRQHIELLGRARGAGLNQLSELGVELCLQCQALALFFLGQLLPNSELAVQPGGPLLGRFAPGGFHGQLLHQARVGQMHYRGLWGWLVRQ